VFKNVIKFGGGLALALLLFWLVLRGVDVGQLSESLRSASIPGLILAAVLMHSQNIFRVLRWKVLLHPVKQQISFRNMFSAIILGYMTTWVIPGRLGELVRPALLSAREKIPLGPCLGSVLADRLMDMMAIVVMFGIGIFLVPFEGAGARYAGEIRTVSAALVVFATLALTLLVLVAGYREKLAPWFHGRGRLVRWIGATAMSVSRGLDAFRSPRLLIQIVATSLLCWFMIDLGTWVGLRSIGVDPDKVNIFAVFVLQPMLAFGVALPTPGGAGGYHLAMKAGLVTLFGIDAVLAVGAGILVHLVSLVPVIFLGLFLLWSEKLSWSDILQGVREVKSLGTGPVEETS
jgi:uncharacterized protein (TIRG00374 family)